MAQERFLDGPLTDIMAQWRHYFETLKICSGDVVVDVGCDTGDAGRFLAAEYPDVAQIVGVENSEARYERALDRWRAGGADPRIEYRKADARNLPFGDAVFDKAICAEMLEFVEPPVQALQELRRVLKPDGVALVVHTDWETQVFATRDRKRSQQAVAAFAGDGPGGDMGRRLYGLCREAGFRLVEPAVYTLVNAEWRDDQYAPKVVELMTQWLRESCGFEAGELEKWREDIQAAVGDGSFFYAVNRFMCRCTR